MNLLPLLLAFVVSHRTAHDHADCRIATIDKFIILYVIYIPLLLPQLRNDILALRAEHNGSKLKACDHVKILKGDKWQSIKENYGDYMDKTTSTKNQKKKFIQMVARLFGLPTNTHGGNRYGVL
jgi:hypothetical protein